MIDLKIQLTGVDQMMRAARSFRERLPGRVTGALNGHVGRSLAWVRRDFETKSGLGRTLKRRGKAHFGGIILQIKTRARGGAIETGIELRGLAGVIERGGRTKEHVIKSRGKGRLAFVGRSGKLVAPRTVNHPGGPVRAHEIAEDHLRRAAPLAGGAVEAAIQKLKAETFG